jgi:hypothetical protein
LTVYQPDFFSPKNYFEQNLIFFSDTAVTTKSKKLYDSVYFIKFVAIKMVDLFEEQRKNVLLHKTDSVFFLL